MKREERYEGPDNVYRVLGVRIPRRHQHFMLWLAPSTWLLVLGLFPLLMIGLLVYPKIKTQGILPRYDCSYSGQLTLQGIDLPVFSNLPYAATKAIDLLWNTIAGRVTQGLLGIFTSRIFMKSLIDLAQSPQGVSYEVFSAISFSPSSITTIWYLLIKGGGNISAIWLAVSVAYLLSFPTLMDAVSGYQAPQTTSISYDNGSPWEPIAAPEDFQNYYPQGAVYLGFPDLSNPNYTYVGTNTFGDVIFAGNRSNLAWKQLNQVSVVNRPVVGWSLQTTVDQKNKMNITTQIVGWIRDGSTTASNSTAPLYLAWPRCFSNSTDENDHNAGVYVLNTTLSEPSRSGQDLNCFRTYLLMTRFDVTCTTWYNMVSEPVDSCSNTPSIAWSEKFLQSEENFTCAAVQGVYEWGFSCAYLLLAFSIHTAWLVVTYGMQLGRERSDNRKSIRAIGRLRALWDLAGALDHSLGCGPQASLLSEDGIKKRLKEAGAGAKLAYVVDHNADGQISEIRLRRKREIFRTG